MTLEVDGIVKRFETAGGSLTAVDGVTLRVETGRRVGLIGESGCGKTSLADVVCGLSRADAGSVALDGVDLQAGLPAGRRSKQARRAQLDVQMVFQQPASTFAEHMTVEQGVMEGLAYRPGIGRREARQRAGEALEAVGLPRSCAGRHAWELSGGQCQRAAIARAVVSRPRLLVCDEPTSALDVTVQASVMELLERLCGELSLSCLFISHDLALVRSFCEEVYVMERGRIVESGPAKELFAHPGAEATKRLVASVLPLRPPR